MRLVRLCARGKEPVSWCRRASLRTCGLRRLVSGICWPWPLLPGFGAARFFLSPVVSRLNRYRRSRSIAGLRFVTGCGPRLFADSTATTGLGRLRDSCCSAPLGRSQGLRASPERGGARRNDYDPYQREQHAQRTPWPAVVLASTPHPGCAYAWPRSSSVQPVPPIQPPQPTPRVGSVR